MRPFHIPHSKCVAITAKMHKKLFNSVGWHHNTYTIYQYVDRKIHWPAQAWKHHGHFRASQNRLLCYLLSAEIWGSDWLIVINWWRISTSRAVTSYLCWQADSRVFSCREKTSLAASAETENYTNLAQDLCTGKGACTTIVSQTCVLTSMLSANCEHIYQP